MLASASVRTVTAAFACAAVAAFASAAAAAPSAPPAPAPSSVASAAAANPLADFYLAKQSGARREDQFELRLRDDGKAWLVSATSLAAPSASASPPPVSSRFETGTWHPDGSKITVLLDTTAPVVGGAPANPVPENETLTFTARGCALALVTAAPAALPGGGGLQFAKRHCP